MCDYSKWSEYVDIEDVEDFTFGCGEPLSEDMCIVDTGVECCVEFDHDARGVCGDDVVNPMDCELCGEVNAATINAESSFHVAAFNTKYKDISWSEDSFENQVSPGHFFWAPNWYDPESGCGISGTDSNWVFEEYASGEFEWIDEEKTGFRITGTMVRSNGGDYKWFVNATFSNLYTDGIPSLSPKLELSRSLYETYSIDWNDWKYYTDMDVILTGEGLLAGNKVRVESRGPAMQCGFGANGKHVGLGCSVWTKWTALELNNEEGACRPRASHLTSDFNFDLLPYCKLCRPLEGDLPGDDDDDSSTSGSSGPGSSTSGSSGPGSSTSGSSSTGDDDDDDDDECEDLVCPCIEGNSVDSEVCAVSNVEASPLRYVDLKQGRSLNGGEIGGAPENVINGVESGSYSLGFRGEITLEFSSSIGGAVVIALSGSDALNNLQEAEVYALGVECNGDFSSTSCWTRVTSYSNLVNNQLDWDLATDISEGSTHTYTLPLPSGRCFSHIRIVDTTDKQYYIQRESLTSYATTISNVFATGTCNCGADENDEPFTPAPGSSNPDSPIELSVQYDPIQKAVSLKACGPYNSHAQYMLTFANSAKVEDIVGALENGESIDQDCGCFGSNNFGQPLSPSAGSGAPNAKCDCALNSPTHPNYNADNSLWWFTPDGDCGVCAQMVVPFDSLLDCNVVDKDFMTTSPCVIFKGTFLAAIVSECGETRQVLYNSQDFEFGLEVIFSQGYIEDGREDADRPEVDIQFRVSETEGMSVVLTAPASVSGISVLSGDASLGLASVTTKQAEGALTTMAAADGSVKEYIFTSTDGQGIGREYGNYYTFAIEDENADSTRPHLLQVTLGLNAGPFNNVDVGSSKKSPAATTAPTMLVAVMAMLCAALMQRFA